MRKSLIAALVVLLLSGTAMAKEVRLPKTMTGTWCRVDGVSSASLRMTLDHYRRATACDGARVKVTPSGVYDIVNSDNSHTRCRPTLVTRGKDWEYLCKNAEG